MPIKRNNIFKSTPFLKKGGQVLKLTDKEIDNYRRGGYIVEEYKDGGTMGDPPPLIPATDIDSMNVYNQAINFEAKLKELGYEQGSSNTYNSFDSFVTGFGTESLQASSFFNNDRRLIQNSQGWALDPAIPKSGTSAERDYGPIGEGHMYLEKIAPYKYKGSEQYGYIELNTDLPKLLYDSRISPQMRQTYNYDGPNSDIASFLKYDPLAVKPWKMLNESEKKERLEKYGTSGTPYDENKPIIKKEYKPNLDTDLSAWLKKQKAPATYAERKKLYEQATGLTDYKGTADQNIGLLNLLKEKGLDYKTEARSDTDGDINIPGEHVLFPNQPTGPGLKRTITKMPAPPAAEEQNPAPTGLTKQVPKTQWKQLPNGTYYQDTKAGQSATVESTGTDIGGRKLKLGGVVMELTEKQIADYRKKGLEVVLFK